MEISSHVMPAAPGAARTATKSHVALYALFLIFGWGSWLTVNGLFTELPLLVTSLPEGWRLGSVLAVVVQLANLGPILFIAARRCGCAGNEERLSTLFTYGVLSVGSLAMFALAAFWSWTVRIGSSEHSGLLISLSFLAALADCTSSLLFWRVTAAFDSVNISALAAGEGLSGVLTSGLAWLQGAAMEQPRFSAGVYFALLGVAMCASTAAFSVICRARSASRLGGSEQHQCELRSTGSAVGEASEDEVLSEEAHNHAELSRWRTAWLLVLQAWINILQNGISVSCLGLAAKPYPDGRTVFLNAQTLSLFVDPLAAAVGFCLPLSAGALVPIALCSGLIYGYVLVLSLEAVTPPLLNAGGGEILVYAVTVGRALTAYAKMRANVLLKGGKDDTRGAEARLFWSGVAMQSGAFVGSMVLYVLINFTSLFRSG